MSHFATRRDFEQAQADHSGKKLVMYHPRPGLDYIQVGLRASVVPLDHPDTVFVTNGYEAITSAVQWYNEETGVFETLNSRYVPSTLVQGTLDLG
jgi:hypothetical protein